MLRQERNLTDTERLRLHWKYLLSCLNTLRPQDHSPLLATDLAKITTELLNDRRLGAYLLIQEVTLRVHKRKEALMKKASKKLTTPHRKH